MAAFLDEGILFTGIPDISAQIPTDPNTYLLFMDDAGNVNTIDSSGNLMFLGMDGQSGFSGFSGISGFSGLSGFSGTPGEIASAPQYQIVYGTGSSTTTSPILYFDGSTLHISGGFISCEAAGHGFFATGNEAFGASALGKSLAGGQNTAVGYQTLYNNFIGSGSVAVGWQALWSNINGGNNVAVGRSALTSNLAGSENVAVGMESLTNNTSGNFNVAIGWEALENSTVSSNNTVVGAFNFINYTPTDGSGTNTIIGYGNTGTSTTSGKNIVLGAQNSVGTGVGNSITIGNNLTALSNVIQVGNVDQITLLQGSVCISGNLSVAGNFPQGSSGYSGISGYSGYSGASAGTLLAGNNINLSTVSGNTTISTSGCMLLAPQSAPTSGQDGVLWYQTNNSQEGGSLNIIGNNLQRTFSGIFYRNLASMTVSDTTAQKSLCANPVVIPANTWNVGQIIRFTARGYVSNAASATLAWETVVGGNVFGISATSLGTSGTNVPWKFEFDVLNLGTTALASGIFTKYTTSTTSTALAYAPVSPVSIITNTSGVCDFQVKWGTASTSDTITLLTMTMEII